MNVRATAHGWEEVTIVEAPSGAPLALRSLFAAGEAKGVIQLNHGAAEHAGRYGEFAQRFAAAGFHVFAHDHRGHGKTTVPGLAPHTFGDNGWALLVDDIQAIHDHIQHVAPGLPRIVLGHSMGAIAAFEYALRQPSHIDAMVLLGPVLKKNSAMIGIFRLLLAGEALFKSGSSPSSLFQKLGWDPLNKPFEPARTPFDWLSSDEKEVDAYSADPECGWAPTVNFGSEMMRGRVATYDDTRLQALRADMPVLLMSGEKDPSTDFGQSVPELQKRFEDAGMSDITAEIFPDMRHELHNEVGRDQVYEKLIAWCLRIAA